MNDPTDPITLRGIASNVDWVTNWIVAVLISGGFAALVSFKDKVTGAALLLAFMSATMLCAVSWPIMLSYGYGGMVPTLALGVVTGVAGFTLLIALVNIIRKVYVPRITDVLTKNANSIKKGD